MTTNSLNKREISLAKSLLKELPYFDLTGCLVMLHGHLNNSVLTSRARNHLNKLTGLSDLSLRWSILFTSILSQFSIYNCLDVPYLRYGLNAWGQADKTWLNEQLILKRAGLRFMCFPCRCDLIIPLFCRAQTSPIHFLYCKLLVETMHNIIENIIPTQLKDLFIPTVKIYSFNTRSSVSNN